MKIDRINNGMHPTFYKDESVWVSMKNYDLVSYQWERSTKSFNVIRTTFLTDDHCCVGDISELNCVNDCWPITVHQLETLAPIRSVEIPSFTRNFETRIFEDYVAVFARGNSMHEDGPVRPHLRIWGCIFSEKMSTRVNISLCFKNSSACGRRQHPIWLKNL